MKENMRGRAGKGKDGEERETGRARLPALQRLPFWCTMGLLSELKP